MPSKTRNMSSEDLKDQQDDNKINLNITNGLPSIQKCVSTRDLNINFLEQIYDIIRCLEKETQESVTPKSMILAREQPSDYAAKINKLKESFEHFRQQIIHVPGSNFSKEEQLQTLCSLRQQLIMKKELLLKYKQSKLADNVNFQPPPSATNLLPL